MRKHGVQSFEFSHYATCDNDRELNELEKRLIQELNTLSPNGYNLRDGGEGHYHHEDTKKKMSKSRTGKPLSKETCEAISQALTGKKKSEEHTRKASEARVGQKRSPEAIANMTGRKHTESENEKNRAWHLGRKLSAESIAKRSQKVQKPVIDQYGTAYESIKAAAEAIGSFHSSVSNVLRGKLKHVKGYVFSYMKKH
jgi:group I intron endonuclease